MLNDVQTVLVLLYAIFAGVSTGVLLNAIKRKNQLSMLPIYGNVCYNVKDKMQDTEVCIDDIIQNFKLLDI